MQATLPPDSDHPQPIHPSSPVSTRVPDASADLQNETRAVAYQLYEARGRSDGHDVDDWLQAEVLLRSAPEKARAA
jgi:hypothetical protein